MQLSGELSKVSFVNLLQLVRSGGLAGKLTLSQGARLASITIDDGLPVNAEMEGLTGKDALYELFLWQSGTFSFSEGPVAGLTRSIAFNHTDETFERFLREGIAYLEVKQQLDSLEVGPDTILKCVDDGPNFAQTLMQNPGLEKIDGVRTLEDALAPLNLNRREFTFIVADWFTNNLVRIAKPDYGLTPNHVELPDWVIARLQQDNPDVSKAIVDMVIWVDRVKCWMYQADTDLERILIAAGARVAPKQTGNSLPGSAGPASPGSGGDFNAPKAPPG